MMKTRASVIARVRAFLEETGMSPHRFGVEAVGDHKFMQRLESGAGITLTVIERAEAFIGAYKPRPQPPRGSSVSAHAAE